MAADGSWEATLRIQDVQQDTEEGRLFVLARDGLAHNFSDSAFPFAPLGPTAGGGAATVGTPTFAAAGQAPYDRIHQVGSGPSYRTNATTLTATSSATRVDHSVLVIGLVSADDAIAVAKGQDQETLTTWTAALEDVVPGEYDLEARLYQGDRLLAKSTPAHVVVNRTSPTVLRVEPSTFGTEPRVTALTVQFGGNPIEQARAENEKNYQIYAASGEGVFDAIDLTIDKDGQKDNIKADYDPGTNSVRITFLDASVITPNVYRLLIVARPDAAGDSTNSGDPRRLRQPARRRRR